MSQHESPGIGTFWEQVYLIERDAGLLCRILGLYAARAMELLYVEYAYAAQDVMTLRVKVRSGDPEAPITAESVQTLLAKAATFVGVIAAAEQPEPLVRRHEKAEA